MSSTIILEDGTGIADANAYVDAADVRAYALLRGITLPAAPESGVDPVEPLLILASDYLQAQRYIGFPATTTQALAWPRKMYLWQDGSLFPKQIVAAQCQLVIEQAVNNVVLQPSTVGGTQFITREKVDVIETQYSEKLGTLSTPTMPSVNAILDGLVIRGGGSGALLQTVRV